MTIEFPSQGSKEENQKAEARLTPTQKILSKDRETRYSNVRGQIFRKLGGSDEAHEKINRLIDEANIFMENGNIKGTIKGHQILIKLNNSFSPMTEGHMIDDVPISQDQAYEILDKYKYLTALESVVKLSDDQTKKLAEDLTAELLA